MVEGFRADLHCHSTCSDGTMSPQEIVHYAYEAGLRGLSITDHDTIDAYNEAYPVAAELGMLLIPGVEFSTIHRGVDIHILGYGYDITNKGLHYFCERHSQRRERRLNRMLELLAEHNIIISIDDILELAGEVPKSWGRPHIARVMVQKGYVSSITEAFKKFLARGKSCYCSLRPFSVAETIDIIRQANGKVVLAHPHLLKEKPVINDLLGMDFDGLEGYYNRLGRDQEAPWVKIAESRGWIITGGSDFHGVMKSDVPIGCSWVREDTFNLLYRHFIEVNGGTSAAV